MEQLPECFFRKYFHITCPFCGGTRFFYNFVKLNFTEAFRYHPTTFVYAIFLIVVTLIYLKDKILKKPSLVNINLITQSFLVYIVCTLIQYVIREILIKNSIEVPFLATDLF